MDNSSEDYACPYCQRIMLAGICCTQAEEASRAYMQSAEYLITDRQHREAFKQAKQQRRAAKRQRRLDRMNATSWDAQDQIRLETSEWEGMLNEK